MGCVVELGGFLDVGNRDRESGRFVCVGLHCDGVWSSPARASRSLVIRGGILWRLHDLLNTRHGVGGLAARAPMGSGRSVWNGEHRLRLVGFRLRGLDGRNVHGTLNRRAILGAGSRPPRPIRTEGFLLQGLKSRDAAFGQADQLLQLLLVERRFFAGALDFHEPVFTGHDDIHVDVGSNIASVVQIQARQPIDDPHADCGDGIRQGVSVWRCAAEDGVDRIDQSDHPAGDGRGASASIGLEHIAVDGEGSFAEFVQIGDRAKRPADQPLDFGGSAVDLAVPFASLALRCAAWEHAVFGRDPSSASARHPFRYFFLDASRAQHDGIATGVEHASRCLTGEVPLDADVANRGCHIPCVLLAAAEEGGR